MKLTILTITLVAAAAVVAFGRIQFSNPRPEIPNAANPPPTGETVKPEALNGTP